MIWAGKKCCRKKVACVELENESKEIDVGCSHTFFEKSCDSLPAGSDRIRHCPALFATIPAHFSAGRDDKSMARNRGYKDRALAPFARTAGPPNSERKAWYLAPDGHPVGVCWSSAPF